LIHAAALSGTATEIRLKQRADSRGSVVLLSDIADIKDDSAERRSDAGQAAAIASLSRIELFPAPGVSRSRTVRRREIRELLGLHGVDLATLRFTGADAVIVRTTERTPRFVQPASHAGRPQRKSFSDAKPIEAVNQQIEAATTELVLSVVNDVRRGEVIRASNVALMPVPVAGKGSVSASGIKPVIHTEDVIGMAAKRPISANQPLDLRALEKHIVVRRGDLITVTSRAPGVMVQTVARATEDAAEGDLVLLESLGNRKKYAARVTGSQNAEVFASGIRVSSPVEHQSKHIAPKSPTRRAAQ